MSQPTPDAYLVERIRSVLAQDSRVNELGIQVTLAGSRVFVTGSVATAERRHAIGTVIAEHFPDVELHNDVSVQQVESKPIRETLS